MTTYSDSGIIAPRILTLDGGEWSALSSSRFTPGDEVSHCPLGGRLGGPVSRCGRGIELRSPRLVTPLTELPEQYLREFCFLSLWSNVGSPLLYTKLEPNTSVLKHGSS
jgi:hypothetical protein